MWPSASTTEKFICATGTPSEEVGELAARRGIRPGAEDLEEEPPVVGEPGEAQDSHAVDRGGLRVVLRGRPELGSDVVRRHSGPPVEIPDSSPDKRKAGGPRPPFELRAELASYFVAAFWARA